MVCPGVLGKSSVSVADWLCPFSFLLYPSSCVVPPRILLHASFLSPVIVVLLWVKPIARDFLGNAPMGKTTVTL